MIGTMEPTEVKSDLVLSTLSDEFREVVARIQNELAGLALDALGYEELAPVDVAEQTVDALALELQQGEGTSLAWREALLEYESAWMEIKRSLGECHN